MISNQSKLFDKANHTWHSSFGLSCSSSQWPGSHRTTSGIEYNCRVIFQPIDKSHRVTPVYKPNIIYDLISFFTNRYILSQNLFDPKLYDMDAQNYEFIRENLPDNDSIHAVPKALSVAWEKFNNPQ